MPHDWTTDPRPLADCLREFGQQLNGGKIRGSRKVGQTALAIRSARTYETLLEGRETPWEATIRLAMNEAERRAAAK